MFFCLYCSLYYYRTVTMLVPLLLPPLISRVRQVPLLLSSRQWTPIKCVIPRIIMLHRVVYPHWLSNNPHQILPQLSLVGSWMQLIIQFVRMSRPLVEFSWPPHNLLLPNHRWVWYTTATFCILKIKGWSISVPTFAPVVVLPPHNWTKLLLVFAHPSMPVPI